MKSILFFATIFFAIVARGEVSFSRKVQLVRKGSNATEAKRHLLHKAVWEVLLERSTELKFDAVSFSNAVQERFNARWGELKELRVKEKLGKGFELTEEAKKGLLDGLEIGRDEEFVKYLRLVSLLDDFTFKTFEKMPEDNWTSEIEFKFNKIKLDRFLKRFSTKSGWTYDGLFVISEMDLVGLSWKELGLERGEDFVSPLRSSWIDLAQDVLSSQIEEIEECKDTCLEEFREWMKSSLVNRSLDSESYFRRGLVLKISYSLKKNGARPHLGEIDLEWEGQFLLLDGESKKAIFSASIPRVQKTFQRLDQKALNSAIAGQMYRNSKDFFQELAEVVKESKRFSRFTLLTLSGYVNLGDVMAFLQKLRKEGGPLSLDPQIDLFTQKEAKILVFYKGEEKSFTDLLSQLKELKSSHSYKILSEPSGNGFSLNFVAE